MYKRRINSSSSEKQQPKKTKSKSSAKVTDASSRKPRTSKSRPNKKTVSSREQSNNILDYLQCRTSSSTVLDSNNAASSSSVAKDVTCKSQASDNSKCSKQFICNAYCPTCQMPAYSLDDNLFQEHVLLCIYRVHEFQGSSYISTIYFISEGLVYKKVYIFHSLNFSLFQALVQKACCVISRVLTISRCIIMISLPRSAVKPIN